MLDYFFLFFFSFPLTELPLPDLHYIFVCFIGGWVGWHGGIFSWEEELIAESCDSFTEQTAVLPLIHPCSNVHPTPGEELPEGTVCLCLSCWNSVPFLVKNALSLTEAPHAHLKQRCGVSRALSGVRDTADWMWQPHPWVSGQGFPGLPS